MNICVVIPVHNESGQIARVVEAVRRQGVDVLVIDDGSTDDSGSLAKEKGAVVIRHDVRKGKGFSLRKAFAYVLGENYDGVITMDGDGQHDAGNINDFLKAISVEPNRVITGSRMGNPRDMPGIRLLTNRLMSLLISAICGQSIPDTQCGYRYISRDILKRLTLSGTGTLTAHDFEIETEVLIKASKMGYEISSLPVRTIYRGERSKINPFRDTIRFFLYLIKEMR